MTGKRKFQTPARSRKLAEMGRQAYIDKTNNDILDRNNIAESPCPINDDEPGYKEFAKKLDEENVENRQCTPSNAKSVVTCVTPRKVLGNIENIADNSLTSPPSKKVITREHSSDTPPKSRRSLPWSKRSEINESEDAAQKGQPSGLNLHTSGLSLLQTYGSDDSQSCHEYPPGTGESKDEDLNNNFFGLISKEKLSGNGTVSNSASLPVISPCSAKGLSETNNQGESEGLLSLKNSVGNKIDWSKDFRSVNAIQHIHEETNFINILDINTSVSPAAAICISSNDTHGGKRDTPSSESNTSAEKEVVSDAILSALNCLNDLEDTLEVQSSHFISPSTKSGDGDFQTRVLGSFTPSVTEETYQQLSSSVDVLSSGDDTTLHFANAEPGVEDFEAEAVQHNLIVPLDTSEPDDIVMKRVHTRRCHI